MGNFESLEKEVINKGKCTHCGACISVCPDYNIEWGVDDHPRRDEGKGMCKNCTECYDSCHKVDGNFDSNKMDNFLFGRLRKIDESLGIYKRIIAAKANDEEILKNAQNGGIATAIALFLLENNRVDGVIATGRENQNGSWRPIPIIATNRDELLSTSGSKYYITPILMKLKEGVIDMELDRLAIIGLPCQVRSARYLQMIEADLAPAITDIIGLFCTKNYDYEKLSKLIKSDGIELKNVKKMTISSGRFHVFANGIDHSFLLKDMEDLITSFCLDCDDYSAEFADISVGNQGSEQGWSTVIIRTSRGEKLIAELLNQNYIAIKKIDPKEIIISSSNKKHLKVNNPI